MSDGIIDLAAYLMGGITGDAEETSAYTPLAFPLEVPTVSGVTAIQWFKDEVRGVTESPFTLHQQVFRHQGDRLRANIILPKMRREHAGEWASLLLQLDGGFGTFLFGDIINPEPMGEALGSPAVKGDNQTGRTLVVDGFNENVVNILKAGDKIQVGNRLYFITRNANTTATGEATLDIWPRLRESPADGDLVRTSNARGTFRLATPGGGIYSTSISGAFEVPSFSIIEAL